MIIEPCAHDPAALRQKVCFPFRAPNAKRRRILRRVKTSSVGKHYIKSILDFVNDPKFTDTRKPRVPLAYVVRVKGCL
jgi:hypothetical protein